jgi:hypothetical protein
VRSTFTFRRSYRGRSSSFRDEANGRARNVWACGAALAISLAGQGCITGDPDIVDGQRGLVAADSAVFPCESDDAGPGSCVEATLTAPRWIYPAVDDQVIDLLNPFQWATQQPGAWLLIGTTAGASDLLYTGRIERSDYYFPSLPLDQTLYAQIWIQDAEAAGQWLHGDIRFQVGSRPVASFVYPIDGATDVDLTIPFSWNAIPDAEAYYLRIGTQPGAADLFDSSELDPSVAAREVSDLPPMQTLYAQIWTKRAGRWAHNDIGFAVSRTRMGELYRPPPGGTLPDMGGFRFSWSEAVGADGYLLRLGTCRGCGDVAKTGLTSGTEWSTPSLPMGVPLYARLFTLRGSTWSHLDSVFSAGAPLPPAVIARPANAQTHFDASTPFSWPEVMTAMAYRLRIGTTAGGHDLHDSGSIRVNQRLVSGLPEGVPLFGSLSTQNDGVWRNSSFVFSVASATVTTRARIQLAEAYTVGSRHMAGLDNDVLLQGSSLHGQVRRGGRTRANCWDYARNLASLLDQAGVGLDARSLSVGFNANLYDTHVAVELRDPTTQTWFVLDPTFMLALHRASDGSRPSPAQLSKLVQKRRFGEIEYRFLDPTGESLIRDYYMDYPLLYLNRLDPAPAFLPVLQYMTEVSLPLPGTSRASYALQCTQGETALVDLDGVRTTVTCDGVESTSHVFLLRTIAPAGDPSSFRVFKVNRYQF